VEGHVCSNTDKNNNHHDSINSHKNHEQTYYNDIKWAVVGLGQSGIQVATFSEVGLASSEWDS